MAKKAAPEAAPHHGFNDVIGIVLMGCAILLLIALLSYDPGDISSIKMPPNHPTHNAIGPIGAWVAYGWLFWIGAPAYLLPFVLIFVIMYFLIIRPQNNRMKKHAEMLKGLKKGDTVLTNGGIIGKVFKLADDEVTLDTGEGGKLRVTRQTIGGLYAPSTAAPAPANDAKES